MLGDSSSGDDLKRQCHIEREETLTPGRKGSVINPIGSCQPLQQEHYKWCQSGESMQASSDTHVNGEILLMELEGCGQ